MTILDLTPNNGRKSFNGKAKVIVNNGVYTLVSYSTEVATYQNGKFERLNYGNKTRTTESHIKAFEELTKGL
jgi:hypothetical protein